MAVTPRSSSKVASSSASPSKSNGRKQPSRIAIDLSDDDDDAQIVEKKSTKRGRPAKSSKPVEVIDDDEEEDDGDDDDDDVEAEDEYEVEAVRTHRNQKGTEKWDMEYLIKWKGWPESDNTWEPESNLPQNIVDSYWKTQPSKSQSKKFEQRQKRKAEDGDDEDAEEEEEEEEENDDDDVEEIAVDSDSDVQEVKASKGKAKNGRRSSTEASKPSSRRANPAKRPRTSTSSSQRRAAASSSEEEDDDQDGANGSNSDSDSDAKAERMQRALNKITSKFLAHLLKRDDWEEDVESIENMQRSPDDSKLQSYVQFVPSASWTRAMHTIGMEDQNRGKGLRAWVDNEDVNKRCPQKVIDFYEKHIRFANPRPAR